jgi:N-methylhydantoinase A
MSLYLNDLRRRLEGAGYERDYLIMQSNGGMATSAAISATPCTTIMSGPAGGVRAAALIGAAAGSPSVLSLDIGGTSSDVCLIVDGAPASRVESSIEGLPLKVRSIAIHTIGAGGGSIARVEAGGRLRVGPASAGSIPGPACYGRGGEEPTITDAAVVAGLVDTSKPLAGEVVLNPDLARTAVEMVARALDISVEEAALGILTVGTGNISHACRAVCLEEGHDPRMFPLVAFGGAGPMLACLVARELGSPSVIVPPHPGVTSAVGLLASPLRQDFAQTAVCLADEVGEDRIAAIFGGLEGQAMSAMRVEGLADGEIAIARTVEARYRGQTHEVEVPLPSGGLASVDEIVSGFTRLHADRYSFDLPGHQVEFVTFRVSAVGPSAPLSALRGRPSDRAVDGSRVPGGRRAGLGEGASELVARGGLAPGDTVEGPAVITQFDTTTAVPADFTASVDEAHNLILKVSA